MPTDQSGVRLEIGHVLFLDVVGYSKLLITEQSELLRKLTVAVAETEQFRRAEAQGKLIRLPTGDGMALVFRDNPEAPAQCAVELAKRLKSHPEVRVRMGIHSGPVNEVIDVNGRTNITGAGINLAQRVMDCADAGHILLSKHVADDLEQYPEWRENLHELGSVEVKHGAELDIVNFYNGEVGNPNLPDKVRQAAKASRLAITLRRRRIIVVVAALVVIASAVGVWISFRPFGRMPALPISEKSIAVLPFENLSAEKENAYFADGVQDEILSNLAKIADLKVISRTSVMLYKADAPRNLREIAQQLGVAHVLEGSVQRAGGKVRVNAQLIDARNDKHLWAKTYDREISDVFAIESELAQLIATEMQAKLSASEKASIEEKPTQDLVAYDLYVRAVPLVDGMVYSSQGDKDVYQAVDLLNQAIARDPNFLLAYCWLAQAHNAIYFQRLDRTESRLALVKSAIDSAFRLKPDSGEAHLALARYLYWAYFDYDHARAEVEIAARTLPNSSRVFELRGWMDRRQSRWSEAVHNLERASELDPRNVSLLNTLVVTYDMLADYDQLRKTYDRLHVLNPSDIGTRLGRAGIERDRRADLRPWRAEIEKILAENPANSERVKRGRFYLAMLERDFDTAGRVAAELPQKKSFEDGYEWGRAFWVGLVARLKGDTAAAQAAFTTARHEQEEIVRAQPGKGQLLLGLAVIDSELGRKEQALKEGRRALELVQDIFERPDAITFFALMCARIGERDLAIEQLNLVVKKPGGPSYGWLRLSPLWDPLRGDPRFEKIVASLAPKDGKQ